jgi:hypothetical protein
LDNRSIAATLKNSELMQIEAGEEDGSLWFSLDLLRRKFALGLR